MSENGIGHNSEMTAEDRRRLYFDHFRKISAATEKVAAANTERKKLRKAAKVDGIVLADIDYGLRCAEIEDTDIIVDELRRRTEIASWMALPVEYQSDMFGNEETPTEDRAYEKGRLASSIGKSAEPMADGYDPSTPQGQAWLRGHADDQSRARDELQSIMEKKNVVNAAREAAAQEDGDGAPKKRGRPKGSSNKPKEDGKTFAQKLHDQNAEVDQAQRENASTH